MNYRFGHHLLGLLFIFAAAIVAALMLSSDGGGHSSRSSSAASSSASSRTAPRQTLRPNTPDIVDRLVMTDSPDAFRAGTLTRVALTGDVVTLADGRERSWPKTGEWVSPQVKTEFPFTELVPSWNVHTPPDTGATFDVRVRDAASGEWTEWLYMGSWGRTLTPVNRTIESGAARVKIDEMILNRPADAYEIRARLVSFDFEPKVTPKLRRVAVTYTGRVADPVLRAKLRHVPPLAPQQWARDLPVPFRPQGDTPPPLRSQTCSPTSVSMVLQYHGVDRPTLENCLAIYDGEYRLFGNWNRAVQRAGEMGLDAWLARFRNWDQVKHEIAQGCPVIASIAFEKGSFPSALYEETDGHLLVIRGFTPAGDVIVNDPARRDKGNGVVYKASELAHAWFDNGGVGYVMRKPATLASVADLERPTTAPTTGQSVSAR
jgi:hypothetical protein